MRSSSFLAARRAPGPRWRAARLAALALGVLSLCAGVLLAAGRRAVPPWAPTLTAEAEATARGVKLAIEGAGWPAGVTVALAAASRPGTTTPADLGTARVGGDGALRASKRTPCSTRDSASARGVVTITARTGDGAARAEATVPAAAWICAGP